MTVAKKLCHRGLVEVKKSKTRRAGHKIQQNMLFTARGRGSSMVMPHPLVGWQIKAEIKGFLLMYSLFLYYLWFFQNIEKGWRKIFEKRLFPRFLKMTKIIKNISSSVFQFSERTITTTETNNTSAESPGSQL